MAFAAEVSATGVVREVKRILQVAKLLALLAGCTYCVIASMFYVRVGSALETLQTTLAQFNAQSASMFANVNATLVDVNRPCEVGNVKTNAFYSKFYSSGSVMPCGTLADVAKTLGTLRGTAGQIEIAANHEDKRIGVLDAQEDALFADTHRTLGSANATLLRFSAAMDTADKTIAGLQPVEAQATATIASVNELMPNLAKTTANVTAMTDSGKNILADGAYETHKLTHPKKKTGFWVGFWFVVEQLKPPIF
ncbi:MAG: hypothetical protein ACYCSP_06000 [Acidobacteriaceae bacterium]